jgi:hypothetical protein
MPRLALGSIPRQHAVEVEQDVCDHRQGGEVCRGFFGVQRAEGVRREFSRQGSVLVEGFPLDLVHGGQFFDRLGLRHSRQDEGEDVGVVEGVVDGDALAGCGDCFPGQLLGCGLAGLRSDRDAVRGRVF